MLNKIKGKLNYLQPQDLGQIFIFMISLPFVMVGKLIVLIQKRNIWLICDDQHEARDNGFCFFKYINENKPEIESYFAIDYDSPDYDKVKAIGKTVRYGSIMHWVLYFSSMHNISSQKAGKPNAAICYVLEVFGLIKSKSIFLQHGITLNHADWLFYENTKMRLFICGAKPEYDYVKANFGYPDENIVYLGFPRFDEYHNISVKKNQIVLMPSWREWIASKNDFSNVYEDTADFTNTEYFQKYQELLNSNELLRFLESENLTLYFYPHRNMQKYISCFESKSDCIRIVTKYNSDIRSLLMDSAVMITDFSSVALDFAYMKKPVIFYQFDEQRFREAQYAEGYFDYRRSGLGTVVTNIDDLICELKKLYEVDFTVSENFIISHQQFFPLHDDQNNERIFDMISSL